MVKNHSQWVQYLSYFLKITVTKLETPQPYSHNSKINRFFLFFVSDGVLISITCKAWAKNIEHDYMERRGTAHFELMID